MSKPPSETPKFSNELTDAQAERLALLIEECGEVIQACAKILRHGYESYNPLEPVKTSASNREMLATEIGHIQHAVARMVKAGDIRAWQIEESEQSKSERIGRWLHHQGGAQ